MKVLVYAHQLEIGGTQTNAIELASALAREHQVETVVFATPGPMVDYLKAKGLRHIAAPEPGFYPSPARMRKLREVLREEQPDLIHVWDWWQGLDVFYGVHLLSSIPVVLTDMNMDLTRVLPRRLPTTFGFPKLVDEARMRGRGPVELLLPPVDTEANAPGAVDDRSFRQEFGVGPEHLTIVTVSRLSEHMKSDGITRTIEAVRKLGRKWPLRYLIVGDGNARPRLEALGRSVNTELGREAVVFTGPRLDPREAYAAADVVTAMGGSALRAMAFAKPTIILGEQGFAAGFNERTEPHFYYHGIYGVGAEGPVCRPIADEIEALARDAARREFLGQFSRRFVLEHFSLSQVASSLRRIFEEAIAKPAPLRVKLWDGIRTTAVYARERRFLTAWRMETSRRALSRA